MKWQYFWLTELNKVHNYHAFLLFLLFIFLIYSYCKGWPCICYCHYNPIRQNCIVLSALRRLRVRMFWSFCKDSKSWYTLWRTVKPASPRVGSTYQYSSRAPYVAPMYNRDAQSLALARLAEAHALHGQGSQTAIWSPWTSGENTKVLGTFGLASHCPTLSCGEKSDKKPSPCQTRPSSKIPVPLTAWCTRRAAFPEAMASFQILPSQPVPTFYMCHWASSYLFKGTWMETDIPVLGLRGFHTI